MSLSERRGSITARQRLYLTQLLRQRHPTNRPSWIDSAHLERLSARDAHRAIIELVSPPTAPEAPCSCGATAPAWAHRTDCETMAATRRRVAERRAREKAQ